MHISKSIRPVVCVTMGYPAGIGPEIISKALASPEISRLANFLIIGDSSAFKSNYKAIRRGPEIDFSKEKILLFDLKNILHKKVHFGIISAAYGRASIEYISKAVSIIKKKKADLLVTAPIHKHAAQLSGFKYPGHTEYLAHLTNTKNYAMMLTGGPLKVILATTHLPIKAVSKKLKKKRIIDILTLADRSLRSNFKIKNPKITVCGLNPHAGEGGLLGDEEKNIITPAIDQAKKKKINATGPYPADAVFYDLYKGAFDAAICMYHDQGLVALKMIARDTSVNITLGLPIIRTSPGHGTALNIAGKNKASCDSMKEAIKTAVLMYKNKKCSILVR